MKYGKDDETARSNANRVANALSSAEIAEAKRAVEDTNGIRSTEWKTNETQ